MSYSPPRKDTIRTAPGVALPPDTNLRIWAGQVISNSSGAWTLDVSNAKFTDVISAVATAQADQTTVTAIPVATIRTYSPTQVSGWVLRSSSGGIILGGMWTGSAFMTTPTRVFVQVVGY